MKMVEKSRKRNEILWNEEKKRQETEQAAVATATRQTLSRKHSYVNFQIDTPNE